MDPARTEDHPHRPGRSVAVLVDDLVTWLVAGLQPTGIQRVVTELLRTAYARNDIDAWPALSTISLRRARPQLLRIDPDGLRWDPGKGPRSVNQRMLRSVRAAVAPLPIPPRLRLAAKSIYAQLTFRLSGIGSDTSRLGWSKHTPSLLLVPGAFWEGDAASRIESIAGEGIPIRMIVYDLIPVRSPDFVEPDLCIAFEQALDRLVPVSDRVITLSREVADLIAERYPYAAGRVHVAVPTLRAHAPKATVEVDGVAAPAPGPFLLVLSTVEPRKNHRVILDAWRLTAADPRASGAWLVIAGRRGWKTDDIEAEIARHGDRLRIARLDHVSDEVVEALYRDCLATVHASWVEGFGLPARESVARGIPTLMSSSIPQDGLPDGTYRLFEPTDAQALAGLMLEAIVAGRVRMPVVLGEGTGWEPVLSALVD